MTYEVERVDVHPRHLAVVRETTLANKLAEVISSGLGEVWDYLRANQVTTRHNLIVYEAVHHDDDGVRFDLSLGVEIEGHLPPSKRVSPYETPGGPAAATVHWGPYDGLPTAHEAVRAWCNERGLALAGVSWEVYGDWSSDPAALRTDVFYLLETPSHS